MQIPRLLFPSLAPLCLSLLFGACVSTSYSGIEYAPTDAVEVFQAEDQVGREFEVMGTIESRAPDERSFIEIQRGLMSDAQAYGADAVLIDAYDWAPGASGWSAFGASMITRKYTLAVDSGSPIYDADGNVVSYGTGLRELDRPEDASRPDLDGHLFKVVRARLIKYAD